MREKLEKIVQNYIEIKGEKYRVKNGKPLICAREECDNLVPYRGVRNKYCSLECQRKALNQRVANKRKKIIYKSEKEAQRTCLNCGKIFESEGPWNRICPTCRKKQDSEDPRMMTGSTKSIYGRLLKIEYKDR